ncbi:DsbA family oxidoreductase [Brevibacterium sp. XM4083]|uniref:DsbA family oxidoreductase n=1 Tax=Brevibacterium sp. XM4083 TaxID=2583238 RepID=UPI001127677E|nr:DsbA family oxidoreductase [Brevibacterium sp. XM4083]MCM1014050.1 DsbA family oxidoreductase [Brevibacterium sp. XM4083]
MKIEIWSDIACPWCYIGKRRFETALEGFPHKDDVEVEWRSFQLDPTLPAHVEESEADYLSRSKGMPAEQVRQMFAQVSDQAAREGLNYDFDSVVVANSFTAHRFLHFAKSHGVMAAAEEALMSGHFESGRDIGSIDYLAEVGQSLGLDPTETRRVLESDEYTDAVKADVAQARMLGANGVPFFVIDRKYGISGAQKPPVFTQALETAWDESQKLTVLAGTGSTAEGGDDYPDGAVCGPEGCS